MASIKLYASVFWWGGRWPALPVPQTVRNPHSNLLPIGSIISIIYYLLSIIYYLPSSPPTPSAEMTA